MAFDTTVTEKDIKAASRYLSQSLAYDLPDLEPDLSVDGLADTIFARLLRLIGLGQANNFQAFFT